MRKLILALACGLALAASACGKAPDDGLASAGGPNNTDKKQVSSDPVERMRQFAQCMRDQGIDMPDPQVVEGEGGEGEFKVDMRQGEAGAGDKAEAPNAAEMEKFEKAEEACRQYMAEGGMLGGKVDPAEQEKMRQLAKCMRENGFEKFPDPQEGGGIAIGPESGIDPRDPKFQEAHKKCEEQVGMTGERKMTEGKPAT
jgi:hypothetical protein